MIILKFPIRSFTDHPRISEQGIFLDSLLDYVDWEIISDNPPKMYYFIQSAYDTYNAHDWKNQAGAPVHDWRSVFRPWEKESVPAAQPKRSYDMEQFAQFAMNRSFEDCG